MVFDNKWMRLNNVSFQKSLTPANCFPAQNDVWQDQLSCNISWDRDKQNVESKGHLESKSHVTPSAYIRKCVQCWHFFTPSTWLLRRTSQHSHLNYIWEQPTQTDCLNVLHGKNEEGFVSVCATVWNYPEQCETIQYCHETQWSTMKLHRHTVNQGWRTSNS